MATPTQIPKAVPVGQPGQVSAVNVGQQPKVANVMAVPIVNNQ